MLLQFHGICEYSFTVLACIGFITLTFLLMAVPVADRSKHFTAPVTVQRFLWIRHFSDAFLLMAVPVADRSKHFVATAATR
jgi:hypothetical protein